MLSALSKGSFKKMQINAGVFLLNFDYTQYSTLAALKEAINAKLVERTDILGATRGGGTFTVTTAKREIEADGKRNKFKGSTIIDSMDATITGNALEITPQNMKMMMASGDVTDSEDGKIHVVKMRSYLKDSDYMDKLCWIGDTVEQGMVLISFDNALNTADVNLTFTDKGEMVMPFTFSAYQEDVASGEYAPFDIVLIDGE